VVKTLAASSDQIKQTLTTAAQTAAATAVEDHAKKDWMTQTKCRSLYSMADCEGYKAPKASATTGAAAATSAATTAAP
jgi:hypothetical protein